MRLFSVLMNVLIDMIAYFYFREDWVTAIQGVADRLAESEDVEMRGPISTVSSVDSGGIGTMDELGSAFSLQGTSSSKSTGKKKVVCTMSF